MEDTLTDVRNVELQQKPYSDVRRARYDDTDKRKGSLHGKTARRLCRCSACRSRLEPELVRGGKAVCFGTSYLETDQEYGTVRGSTLAEPYNLTKFELEGLDASHSLDRDHAWEAVPCTLAKHAVGLPAVRKLADGRVETVYQLEPAAQILPDPTAAKEHNRMVTHIYQIHRHRPKLEAVVPTEPPEHLNEPLLPASLHCAGNRVPQVAFVRCNSTAAYWDVASARGKPLDVDLGSACLISAVSTQARHPSLRTYPHIHRDPTSGSYEVEDAEYLPNHVQGAKYKGPWWNVRAVPGTHARFVPEPMWVGRYELSWRADGGRKWHSAGVFAGNTDEISEVAHEFGTLRGGLRARYLRIRPIDCEGGGALRVGVYGRTLAAGATTRGAYRHVGSAVARRASARPLADGEGDGLVEYKLTSAAPKSYTRDGNGVRNDKWRYGDTTSSASRRRRRLEVTREAHEISAHTSSVAAKLAEELRGWDRASDFWDTPLDDVNDDDDDDDEEEEGLTAEEREELQLALALSASLAVDEVEHRGSDASTECELRSSDLHSSDFRSSRASSSAPEDSAEASAGGDDDFHASDFSDEEWLVVEAQ